MYHKCIILYYPKWRQDVKRENGFESEKGLENRVIGRLWTRCRCCAQRTRSGSLNLQRAPGDRILRRVLHRHQQPTVGLRDP